MTAIASLVPTGPLHPQLLAAALAVAVVAIGASRLARRPALAVHAAALGAALELVITHHADGLLVLAVAVAIGADGLRGRRGLQAAGLAATALLAVGAARDAPTSCRIGIALAIVVLGASRSSAPRPEWLTVGLVAGALAAIWAGGPDTEAAVVSGAALLPAVATATGASAPAGPTLQRGALPVAVMVAWTATDAYRGRPAGLPSAAFAVALIALVSVLTANLARHTTWYRGRTAIAIAGAVLVAAWASEAALARTVGLAHHPSTAGTAISAASVTAALAAAGIAAAQESRRA